MALDAAFVTQIRSQFTGVNNKFYFNYGGQGILPQPALQAILETYQFLAAEGPFSIKANRYFQAQTQALRQAIADEMQVNPDTITITDNVTTGCNIVLWGINWQSGDHVLISDCEHPGVIAILQILAQRFGITYSECPLLQSLQTNDPDSSVLESIQAHLTPRTRLVVLSHLLWNTGQLLPLEKIIKLCHTYGGNYAIQVLVDGAQSAGSVPLNLGESAVDYYAFTGHKWFCGPAGVGGLYLNPKHFDQLLPTYVGWRSLTYNAQGLATGWTNQGSRFEVATAAFPQFQGLRAALECHRQGGDAQERYQQLCQQSQSLWQGLQTIPQVQTLLPDPPQAGLVSFQVSPDASVHSRLVQQLEENSIYLRAIAFPSCIRACCHYFTTAEEIDHLLTVLRQLLTMPSDP